MQSSEGTLSISGAGMGKRTRSAAGPSADGGAMVQERLPNRSVERLALEAPAEAVGGAQQAAHADAVVLGIAAGVAGDDDVIARLQRRSEERRVGTAGV